MQPARYHSLAAPQRQRIQQQVQLVHQVVRKQSVNKLAAAITGFSYSSNERGVDRLPYARRGLEEAAGSSPV